ncbi:MAG TPA: sensor histidine kinase KdpD [Alphaproteobacteria bacterium]|nr:sensor histidine kinase KdpD [Alphaproteobacteria bacterium]
MNSYTRPDALLEEANREKRGKLKIFLGAAPGVGKTYEMLQNAQNQKKQGMDVVVGLVETHGRRETESLISGLEIVPRQRLVYKGRLLEEMDLDAILKRAPQLVLVDEFAHTNAADSRHPKRYMDVEEILAAGINVYTTLNIQHLESLNDVVAQITNVRVRETIPDRLIDQADEIELIDLTPQDLIKRVQEGKVYVGDQAQRALQNYFTEGNLTALRELALRQTAQHVDDDMVQYMQSHSISGPWAAGERILVCVNENPSSYDLIRYARRTADKIQAKWVAVYIESTRHHTLSAEARDRVAGALRLAEQLGGDTVIIPGRQIATDLLTYAREHNITQIILGKSPRSKWFEMVHGSIVRDLVRHSGKIGIHVIAAQDESLGKSSTTSLKADFGSLFSYIAATGLVGLALMLGWLLNSTGQGRDLAIFFLAAVFLISTKFGLAPALYASLLSALAYNYFLTPPFYTLTIAEPVNFITFGLLLLVSILASKLNVRLRNQATSAQQRAKTTTALYNFSRRIAAIGDVDNLLNVVSQQIAEMLQVQVVLLQPEGDKLVVRAGYPLQEILDDSDYAAAKWAWDHDTMTGPGTDTLPGAKRLFIPLKTERDQVGLLGLYRDQEDFTLSSDEKRLLDALADQTAVAIERVHLAEDIDQAKIISETGRFRSLFLAWITQDLDPFLQQLIQQIQGLSLDHSLPEYVNIHQNVRNIDRFVHNLRFLSDYEQKKIGLEKKEISISEIDLVISQSLEQYMPGNEIHWDRDDFDTSRLVAIDETLFKRAMINLLETSRSYGYFLKVHISFKKGFVCWVMQTDSSASHLALSNNNLAISVSRIIVELHQGSLLINQSPFSIELQLPLLMEQ